jgi:hypothetical protein
MILTTVKRPLLFALFALLVGCTTTQSGPDVTEDGLQRVNVKGIDAVYRKPDANFQGYNELLLRQPIEVTFRKDWKPESQSQLYSMHPPDREAIKKAVSDNFYDVFKEELEKKGSYKFVQEPAANVLEVRAAIVDVYITAPDVSMQTPGRVQTYSADTGEMTLVMELRDSVTGAVLARAFDRRSGGDNAGHLHWSNSTWNQPKHAGSWPFGQTLCDSDWMQLARNPPHDGPPRFALFTDRPTASFAAH